MEKIKAYLANGRVYSNSHAAFSLLSSSNFGEKIESKVIYLSEEALFLAELGKMMVYLKEKKLKENKLLEKLQKQDSNFYKKYIVFKDLRKKGYVVKGALKFGADFRV